MTAFRATLGHLLVGLFVLTGSACFRSASVDPDDPGDTCDCCGTDVAIRAGESCFGGVCDPYCGVVPSDGGVDAPTVHECDCCGTLVSTTDPCSSAICDPFCRAFDCAPLRADITSLDHVAAGRPTTVQAIARGCYCGERFECEAEADPRTRTLRVRTSMCTGDLLCDGCMNLETDCELPALDDGPWTVEVNDDPAYELNVVPGGARPERADVYITHAPVDRCGLEWPPEAYDPFFTCIDPEVHVGRMFPVRVFDECASEACGHRAGHCQVTVLDNVIHVDPTRTISMCDIAACPPVCEWREDVCWVPPLAEGGYNVVVGGDIRGRVLVTPDPSPAEACSP